VLSTRSPTHLRSKWRSLSLDFLPFSDILVKREAGREATGGRGSDGSIGGILLGVPGFLEKREAGREATGRFSCSCHGRSWERGFRASEGEWRRSRDDDEQEDRDGETPSHCSRRIIAWFTM
jgi:hypothetical protein